MDKFTHEHYVINKEQAAEAKAFFDIFIMNTLNQVNGYLNAQY